MSEPDAEPIDPGVLALAGGIVTVVSAFGLLRFAFVGLAAGPIFDTAVTPLLFRLLRRRYRTPGAPLWSVSLAAVAWFPAIATLRGPAVGFLVTLATVLPAVVLGILGLRRPLRRIARIGILVACSALLFSGVSLLVLGT